MTNEIEVLDKIIKIHGALKEKKYKKIIKILSEKNRKNKLRCSNTYARVLKIIRGEIQNKSGNDKLFFVLFSAFYYKNIYDFFKPEFYIKINKEVHDFKAYKSNIEKYFMMSFEELKGFNSLKDFINEYMVNNELFKMFLRGECSIITFMLYDYFFDISKFTPKDKISKKIWDKLKVKYTTLKVFLDITNKNLKLKEIKSKIFDTDGKFEFEEMKMAINKFKKNSEYKNELLKNLSNKNNIINSYKKL